MAVFHDTAHLHVGRVRDGNLPEEPPGAKLRALPVPTHRCGGQIVDVSRLNGRNESRRK
jgi:hypothetical protein